MKASDAHVLKQLDLVSKPSSNLHRFRGDRQVGAPRRDHQDGSLALNRRFARPDPDQSRKRVVFRLGQLAENPSRLFGFDARDEDILPGLLKRSRRFDDLFGRFFAAVDNFWYALAQRAMGVDARILRDDEGKLRQSADRTLDIRLTSAHGFEQLAKTI